MIEPLLAVIEQIVVIGYQVSEKVDALVLFRKQIPSSKLLSSPLVSSFGHELDQSLLNRQYVGVFAQKEFALLLAVLLD